MFPEQVGSADGYLEVFDGEGDGWSFVAAGENKKVLKTTEKVRISSLCSTGLYYFSRVEMFNNQFKKLLSIPPQELQGGEYYVAPMYNDLIASGLEIKYVKIGKNEVIFSGVPAEYEQLLENPGVLNF